MKYPRQTIKIGAPDKNPLGISKLKYQEHLPFEITNTTDKTQRVSLFDIRKWYHKEYAPEGVIVRCPTTESYDDIILEMFQRPFEVNELQYSAMNKAQLCERFVVGYSKSTGVYSRQVYTPQYRASHNAEKESEINDPTFEFTVCANSFLEIDILPGEVVVLVFTISKVYDVIHYMKICRPQMRLPYRKWSMRWIMAKVFGHKKLPLPLLYQKPDEIK